MGGSFFLVFHEAHSNCLWVALLESRFDGQGDLFSRVREK
jgi:hypothetical protein